MIACLFVLLAGIDMARRKKLVVSAINLTIHPHTGELYTMLLRDAFELRRAIRVRGDTHMAISFMNNDRINKDGLVLGQIARFTNIDIDRPWFDAETLSEAKDNQLESLNIPHNLRPNMKSISFIFDVQSHTFIFEQYFDGLTVSPRQVHKFLTDLFSDKKILKKYGKVNIRIVSDRENIASMLDFDVFKKLTIKILPPNPDDNGNLDEIFEELLTEQNAESIQLEYRAGQGQSLELAAITLSVAEVASQNGEVIAQGKTSNGITSTRSTKDHPATEVIQFDPDIISGSNAFLRAARNLISRFTLIS